MAGKKPLSGGRRRPAPPDRHPSAEKGGLRLGRPRRAAIFSLSGTRRWSCPSALSFRSHAGYQAAQPGITSSSGHGARGRVLPLSLSMLQMSLAMVCLHRLGSPGIRGGGLWHALAQALQTRKPGRSSASRRDKRARHSSHRPAHGHPCVRRQRRRRTGKAPPRNGALAGSRTCPGRRRRLRCRGSHDAACVAGVENSPTGGNEFNRPMRMKLASLDLAGARNAWIPIFRTRRQRLFHLRDSERKPLVHFIRLSSPRG